MGATADDVSLNALAAHARESFSKLYGRTPLWLAAAPGRVNLIGEHIDYNDGFVLPMAIERYTVIAAAPRTTDNDAVASVHSLNLGEERPIPLVSESRSTEGWASYVEGVVSLFRSQAGDVPPFDAVIASNVPLGGGLSSSAALEVAVATLLEAMTGTRLGQTEKALLCQQAEHKFAGVPCGIMDQFSSVYGAADELMLLDCRSREIRSVPFAGEEVVVLIANSNVRHELAGGEYAVRRAQCDSALARLRAASWRDVTPEQLDSVDLPPDEQKRARHVVGEIARTVLAAGAISQRDWKLAGTHMYASHASLRDDYEVSCPELDLLVEIASDLGSRQGVHGARMTGGGFGGCTVNLVQAEAAADVAEALRTRYRQRSGIDADIFMTRPARGAHVVNS